MSKNCRNQSKRTKIQKFKIKNKFLQKTLVTKSTLEIDSHLRKKIQNFVITAYFAFMKIIKNANLDFHDIYYNI